MNIQKKDLDRIILGYTSEGMMENEFVDRTIVKFPNTDKLVMIYNKYQEEVKLLEKARLFREEQYKLKPVAFIPEENVEVYSRCIVCRINEAGKVESLQKDDMDKILKYLSE